MEISNALVVALGVGIVFIGLICIIILCKIMSAICMMSTNKDSDTSNSTSTPTVAAPVAAQPIQNRQEIIAAVSAALAEELGTDVSAIRILSFKKI